ncbi:MAG: cobalamin-binding protein, partial [Burkholderiales bacterium]
MLAAVTMTCALGPFAAGVRAESGAVYDDLGRPVPRLPLPQRVVTLAPHATELAVAAGLGGRLVAVDPASDRPAAIRNLP